MVCFCMFFEVLRYTLLVHVKAYVGKKITHGILSCSFIAFAFAQPIAGY